MVILLGRPYQISRHCVDVGIKNQVVSSISHESINSQVIVSEHNNNYYKTY